MKGDFSLNLECGAIMVDRISNQKQIDIASKLPLDI